MVRFRKANLIGGLVLLAIIGGSLWGCAKETGKTPGPAPGPDGGPVEVTVTRPNEITEAIPTIRFNGFGPFNPGKMTVGGNKEGTFNPWPMAQKGGYEVVLFGTTGTQATPGPQPRGGTFRFTADGDGSGWRTEILLAENIQEIGKPVGVLTKENPTWAAEIPYGKQLWFKTWAPPETSPEMAIQWDYTVGDVSAVKVVEGKSDVGLPAIFNVGGGSGGKRYTFGTPIWTLEPTEGGYVIQTVTGLTGMATLTAEGPGEGWSIQVLVATAAEGKVAGMLTPIDRRLKLDVPANASLFLKVQGQPGTDLSGLVVTAELG